MLTTRSTHRTTIVAALACALLAIAAPVAAAPAAGHARVVRRGGREGAAEAGPALSRRPRRGALKTTATAPLPGPPTWPVNPEPIGPPPVVQATDDGGLDWTTIGLGFGGSLLVVGAVAGVVLHSRRAARSHVAA